MFDYSFCIATEKATLWSLLLRRLRSHFHFSFYKSLLTTKSQRILDWFSLDSPHKYKRPNQSWSHQVVTNLGLFHGESSTLNTEPLLHSTMSILIQHIVQYLLHDFYVMLRSVEL